MTSYNLQGHSKNIKLLGVLLPWLLLVGCGESSPKLEEGSDSLGYTSATQATIEQNNRLAQELPLDNQEDFIEASRGLIASVDGMSISTDDGRVIWDQGSYDFIQGDAPATVNPSLWRQEKLNGIHGLFEVTPGVYQLRGFDLANLTLIDTDSGWIVVDPLTTEETSRFAMNFAREHLGNKPVKAVIFTHSHIDHFGGVHGLFEENQGEYIVIAPEGFMAEAVSENLLAGVAMSRRAEFMYGRSLPVSARAHVGTGLGKEPAKGGSISIHEPDVIVSKTGQTLTVDGLELEFQNAPGSEAPAELTFYLPKYKAFCGGEVITRNMHNLYTLRGAKVRDALAWSSYIDEMLDLYGNRSDVYFGTHHWPIWGQDKIQTFIKQQRDTYKFIHDQTLRLANRGFTPKEIAEQLALPSTLKRNFSNRGYYGTLSHNAKAVYQMYFGWYDANPANLNPLPPEEAGQRYVALMGGAEQLLMNAQQAFESGEYRWVAEILNHLVFAQPDNQEAKGLLAKTYDQLGYQAESAPWRDAYLTGAYELRHGKVSLKGESVMADAAGLINAIPTNEFFVTMATNLDGVKADGESYTINIHLTDTNERYVLSVENSVLHHHEREPAPNADASISMTRALFLSVLLQQVSIKDLVFGDELSIEGSGLSLIGFFSLFDQADGQFPVVTP